MRLLYVVDEGGLPRMFSDHGEHMSTSLGYVRAVCSDHGGNWYRSKNRIVIKGSSGDRRRKKPCLHRERFMPEGRLVA